MGLGGNIRQVYYDALNLIIYDFEMVGDQKPTPPNEWSCIIRGLIHDVLFTMFRANTSDTADPTISYLHTPGERRYSDVSLEYYGSVQDDIVDRCTINWCWIKRKFQASILI